MWNFKNSIKLNSRGSNHYLHIKEQNGEAEAWNLVLAVFLFPSDIYNSMNIMVSRILNFLKKIVIMRIL